MLGKLLGGVVRLATVPLDVAEIGMDLMTGGDGNRKEMRDAFPCASELRDKFANALEQIDD